MELETQNSLAESIWIQACNWLIFVKSCSVLFWWSIFWVLWINYMVSILLCQTLSKVYYSIILIQANWFCQTLQCYLQMWCELRCQTLYHHLTRGLPFATFIMLKVLCLDNGWFWKMATLIESQYKVLLNWLVSFNLI